ncbi:MAG: amidohydrolase [Pseudomonadaceae bacterium]|nr:amidohydrolase [Pseudomonadaceae bacterium]
MKPKSSTSLLLAVATTLSLVGCASVLTSNPDGQPADRVLLSNNVITMTSDTFEPATQAAVAVRDDTIVWVGAKTDAAAWIGEQTVVDDLGNAALLPGFIDAHGHVAMQAMMINLANVASPPVGPVQTVADLKAVLRSHIADNDIPPGTWVLGTGYDDSLISEQRHPTRDDLDAVSDAHPIALLHVSAHLMAVNSEALAKVGIDTETENPAGGVIRRRPDSSEPNGVLEESALYQFWPIFAAANDDPMQALEKALDLYASYGITTAQDGASNPDSVALFRAAAAQQQLPIDVIAYPVVRGDGKSIVNSSNVGTYENGFKLGGAKLVLDGSPQGKTAYLTQPYFKPPPGQSASYLGYPIFDAEKTRTLVHNVLEANVPLIAHANGDAAADMLIEAVASADRATDHRTVMIHAQTVREDQLDDMKSLGIIPSFFSAHTFYWGDWHRDSVFGEERARRISPTATTLARDMPFTVHNDAPVVPANMLRLLWATTNRQTRSGKTLGGDQALSTYDALRAVTTMAAYSNFDEDSKGSIEPGKQADFVVLSRDPLAIDPADLQKLEVLRTYARGAQVFPSR